MRADDFVTGDSARGRLPVRGPLGARMPGRHAACPARPVYTLPRAPADPRSFQRPSRATRRFTSIGLGAATTAS